MKACPQITQMNADSTTTHKDPKTYAIIGAAMEVHRQLGHGFLEAVYQEALAIEFVARGIPFQREVDLRIEYKDRVLRTRYRADFVCYNTIVIETKAIGQLTAADMGQVINELKATGLEIGLLINFGGPSLEYRRLVFTKKKAPAAPGAGHSMSEIEEAADPTRPTTPANLRESAQSADNRLAQSADNPL